LAQSAEPPPDAEPPIEAELAAGAEILDPQQRREIQQQVRETARSMVAQILDVQLKQLEENRLTSHPWYGQIRAMRTRVDDLIEAEMPELIAMLGQLEGGTAGDRDAALLEARARARQIVSRLAAERFALLHRLQVAEITAQARRLIELQSNALAATDALSSQPIANREASTLATIEDQRDVAGLFDEFVVALGRVSRATWHGPLPAEAARGLKQLEEAGVKGQLGAAVGGLRSASFAEAAASQKAVIGGLQTLLEQIERAEGLKAADGNAAAGAIRRLIEQQRELRRQTQQADANLPDGDPLVNGQSDIRRQIAEFAKSLRDSPAVGEALDEAEKAASDAAEELFAHDRDGAVAKQDQVLEHLEAAASQAGTGANDEMTEMAVAAAALDAAVEAEQQIAEAAGDAAGARGLDAESAAELGKKQDVVEQLVDKVAEGIIEEAPAAAETLQQAKPPMQGAGSSLAAAGQTPGEASKPAAATAASRAQQAAEKLTQAAGELRAALQRMAAEAGQSVGAPMPGMPGGASPTNAAIREAAQLAAQLAGASNAGAAPNPAADPIPTNTPGAASGAGGGPADGQPGQSQTPADMAAQTPDSAADDPGELLDRQLQQDPWFARLPPEVRAAIRSNARRPFPRGYEERLKQYFRSGN